MSHHQGRFRDRGPNNVRNHIADKYIAMITATETMMARIQPWKTSTTIP